MNFLLLYISADCGVRLHIRTPHNHKVAASCLVRFPCTRQKYFEELSRFTVRRPYISKRLNCTGLTDLAIHREARVNNALQKGGVPATPSGTATLLRLSPSHQFCPRPLLSVTNFRHPRLPWLDGRCVQGPGTYSPRHG